MKIVYITGCLGFMGSYITRKALERGWMVRGVDKITYAANEEFFTEFSWHKNFAFEEKDIKDLDYLYDCDYVINFAAESHVGNSIIDSEVFIDTNVGGVRNLLELIRHKPNNVNNRPILFHISTDEVYGDVVSGAHQETDLLRPSNPYSASKAAGDMLINAWARTYDLDYVILRPTNNYGIGQYPEKLIPLSIKNLKRGKKIRLHNNGTPTRNWLHASDTASAVMKIIDAGIKNEIFNVAGGFEQQNIVTVKKIIEAYFGTLDNWKNHVDFSYTRKGQDVRYAIDDTKLRKLGWLPQCDFNLELVKIVNHYRKNFRW
jgi:dTDP-glucose 4,6-dehydratase